MPKTPKLRAAHGTPVDIRAGRTAARVSRDDRVRDIFLRTTAVAKDPDGEHIWLLLKSKGE